MKKLISVFLCLTMLAVCFAPAAMAAENTYDTPFEDSRFFEIGDYSIHYRVKTAQSPKGYILFIHGFAMSGSCFDELSEIMHENGYTCVSVDLPGYGYSTRETADTQFMTREEILYELTQSIFEGKWIISGHSMGGYVALSMLASYPQAVETLLLYGTSGEDGFSAEFRAILSNEFLVKIAGSFMGLLAKSDLLIKLLLTAALGDAEYAANYDTEKVSAPLRIEGTGVGAMYAMLNVTPTDYEAVAAFGSPILFMNGSEDNVISKADRDKLASFLPADSENIVMEGGYHLFIENMAAEVAAETLEFLER